MFEVYCHTSPSGKSYVGYSRDGMSARWREHVQETNAGSMRLICRAIRKHGPDSFRHELLTTCDTEAGAHASERYWVAARKTLAPLGYNATAGGDGGERSEYVKAKLRASWTPERREEKRALLAVRNPGNTFGRANLGKRRTAEERARMSAAQRAVGFARHTTPHTAETKAKISAANKRRFQSADERVKCGNGNRGKPWSAARRAAHERQG